MTRSGYPAGIVAALLLSAGAPAAAGTMRFDSSVVDAGMAGDCKMAGDIDGDGKPDLVVGGMPGEGLVWYRWPDWRKTLIAEPVKEFTTFGALGDVDGDGDLDVVVPDGDGPDNLVWFENPGPAAPTGKGVAWTRHVIGSVGGWGKDVHAGDFDSDGRLDVAVRAPDRLTLFFGGPRGWTAVPLAAAALGEEGMGSGDVDGDGDADLVIRGAWLENPGGDRARGGGWAEHAIGDAPSSFKALVSDLDGDGRAEVLFSASEGEGDVTAWRRGADGGWSARTLLAGLDRAHTLQAGDMDGDGDTDVVVAQLPTSQGKRLLVLENLDGHGTRWAERPVAADGLHNGVVADIGGDGDPDIFGSGFTGHPPVRLYVNRADPGRGPLPIDRWTHVGIADGGDRTFGLGFGDVDGDGRIDVIAGRAVYRNPGADLTGRWDRIALPSGRHGFAALEDDAGRAAVIAMRDAGDIEVSLNRYDPAAGRWDGRPVGTVPKASHALGTQGYAVADIEPGGLPEIVMSSGGGVFYFAAAGNDRPWRRVRVSPEPSDEGIAVADMDGDGRLDIAATTGDRKEALWFRNPGDGGELWVRNLVGTVPEAVFPDRIAAADLDGDGRTDIVVTEENGEADGAGTWLFRQPADARPDQPWAKTLMTRQGSTNSLGVVDIDQDGRIDLITAEHRGALRLILWHNEGGGFMPVTVGKGHENHLGARPVDIDGDGDLDLVGIAYDDAGAVHLWRNDGILIAGRDVTVTPEEPGLLSTLLQKAERWLTRMLP